MTVMIDCDHSNGMKFAAYCSYDVELKFQTLFVLV
jgi:hypothetical protein